MACPTKSMSATLFAKDGLGGRSNYVLTEL